MWKLCISLKRCRTIMHYLYSLFESFREKIITVLYSDVILPRRIHPGSRNLERNRKTFSSSGNLSVCCDGWIWRSYFERASRQSGHDPVLHLRHGGHVDVAAARRVDDVHDLGFPVCGGLSERAGEISAWCQTNQISLHEKMRWKTWARHRAHDPKCCRMRVTQDRSSFRSDRLRWQTETRRESLSSVQLEQLTVEWTIKTAAGSSYRSVGISKWGPGSSRGEKQRKNVQINK